MMMEIVPLLITSGYRTWNNILLTYGERAKPVLVWDTGELFSMGLLDLALNVSILVFKDMLALKWLEAIARNLKF